jgi:anti-anti-sigma regulatory factor
MTPIRSLEFRTPELEILGVQEYGIITLHLAGEAGMTSYDTLVKALAQLNEEVHALGGKIVRVDFQALESMSSSCLKAFVGWIDVAKAGEYKIRFVSAGTQSWHKRSLGALRLVAPELIEIEA